MKKQMICSFLAVSLAGMMCAGCGQSTEKKDLKLSSLDEKKGDENHPPLSRIYTDLAKCAVSDIYHYGMVPAAMPEIALHLMASKV